MSASNVIEAGDRFGAGWGFAGCPADLRPELEAAFAAMGDATMAYLMATRDRPGVCPGALTGLLGAARHHADTARTRSAFLAFIATCRATTAVMTELTC